jgi:predicted Zn-dependent protease
MFSRKIAAALCACMLSAVLSGCATNPITGRSQLKLVSEESAIKMGGRAYSSLMGREYSRGTVVGDPVIVRRIQGITDKVIAEAVKYRPESANWNWEVKVIDEPDNANAACFPGGKMMVYTGLIHKVGATDSELAQVMSHEVAHALLGHSAEKLSMGLLSQLMVITVGAAANDRGLQRDYEMTADLATKLFLNLPNSRTTEAEADSVGIELAARAGYDPHAAVSLWEKMISSGEASRSKSDWAYTHPATVKRIAALNQLVDSLMPVYLNASGQLLDATTSTTVRALQQDITLEQMCDLPSRVDRAQCLGTVDLGFTQEQVVGALGTPTSGHTGATMLQYDDRYLQFDEKMRLTGILESKP